MRLNARHPGRPGVSISRARPQKNCQSPGEPVFALAPTGPASRSASMPMVPFPSWPGHSILPLAQTTYTWSLPPGPSTSCLLSSPSYDVWMHGTGRAMTGFRDGCVRTTRESPTSAFPSKGECCPLDLSNKLNRHAVAAQMSLVPLQHRSQVVPRPVDHQARPGNPASMKVKISGNPVQDHLRGPDPAASDKPFIWNHHRECP